MNDHVAAVQAAWERSTQDEWTYGASSDGNIFCVMGDAHKVAWDIESSCDECFGNMDFIATAHNHWPDVMAYIRQLEAQLAKGEQS